MVYTMVTKPVCARCRCLKSAMERGGHAFVTEDLDTPEKVEAFKAEFPTARSVPVLLDEQRNMVDIVKVLKCRPSA